MAGLLGYALAGAAAGAGTGLVERAKSLAAAALEKRQADQRAAERAQDRQWQLDDLTMKRGWDMQDANTQRQWDLQDAAAARKPAEDATAAFNRLFGSDQPQSADAVPASYVRDGLVARGLPLAAAEGFTLEGDQESGLRPGINEQNPTVPGSRGGFGLFQWTGPRRVALEKFAAAQGTSASDVDTQLDFVVHELKGSESDAASKIMSARDRNEAGKAVATFFLRPREDHLARRVARYDGAQAPEADRRDLLMQVLAMPGLSDGQRAVIGEELKRMAPPEPQSAKGKEAADRANGFLPEAEAGFRPATAEEAARYGAKAGQFGPDGRFYPGEATQGGFRLATPQEAAQYGAQAGQFGPDGRFYPINQPSGMTVFGPDGKPIVQTGGGGARFTEGQSKDNVYSVRAKGALPDVDAMGDALANWGDVQLDRIPLDMGRYLQSDQFKIAQNAGDEFLTAILRKDTGAAITNQEQEIYGRMYLPRPGDPPGLLLRKKEARARAISAIEAGMSPEQMLAQERALQQGGTNAGMSDADLFGKYGLAP